MTRPNELVGNFIDAMYWETHDFEPSVEDAEKIYDLVHKHSKSVIDEDKLLSMILGINDHEMHQVRCPKGHLKRYQLSNQSWACLECNREYRRSVVH